jgi:tetratricopeptide (TPR) repeat protein
MRSTCTSAGAREFTRDCFRKLVRHSEECEKRAGRQGQDALSGHNLKPPALPGDTYFEIRTVDASDMNRKERRVAASRSRRDVARSVSAQMTNSVTTTVDRLMSSAIQFYQYGKLAEAEQCYHRSLANDPTHMESLHNLGMIAYQLGRHENAIALIRKAIALNDRIPYFHNSIGVALYGVGRLEQAVVHPRGRRTDYWPSTAKLRGDSPRCHISHIVT